MRVGYEETKEGTGCMSLGEWGDFRDIPLCGERGRGIDGNVSSTSYHMYMCVRGRRRASQAPFWNRVSFPPQ